MYSESQKKATLKYMKNNYDEIKIRIKKGKKEEYRQYAESVGQSLNSFIITAIEEKIKQDHNSNE